MTRVPLTHAEKVHTIGGAFIHICLPAELPYQKVPQEAYCVEWSFNIQPQIHRPRGMNIGTAAYSFCLNPYPLC